MSTVAAGEPAHRSLAEKLALGLEIARTCVAVRRRLGRDGLPQTLEWLRLPLGNATPTGAAADLELGRAVRRTLVLLPSDSRCLTQSLVLIGLLARRGVPAKLLIGVEATGEQFGAHAWVEYDERALLPPGTDPEKRLAEL